MQIVAFFLGYGYGQGKFLSFFICVRAGNCYFSYSNCVKQWTITSKSIHVKYSLQEMKNLLKHEAAGLILQEEGFKDYLI